MDLHEGEFALSKDLNVALWIQYRTCNEATSLREVCGGSFVIVIDDLEAQFQDFKRQYSGLNYSFVEAVEILRLWWNAFGDKAKIKAVSIFEKHYLQMSSLNLDEFCQWVYHVRERSVDKKKSDILEGKHEILFSAINYLLTQLQYLQYLKAELC